MSKALIECASESTFNACVPDTCERQIVFGSGSAFVFVATDEPMPDATQRAIAENGWLPRGLVGLSADDVIVILHNPPSPDFQTMATAAKYLDERASAKDQNVADWLDRLAALPDPRPEGEDSHA